MNALVARLENTRLAEVAHEYEREGYRVVRRPGKAELPDFLAGFEPDLIAYGADENVVIEVRSKPTLADSPNLVALSEAVGAMPQWRLDLVVTNNGFTRLVGADGEELDDAGIRERVAHVHHLLRIEQEEAAALLAWSAAEATLRIIARREGVDIDRPQPAYIVETLYSLGLLGQDDYAVLQAALQLRNLIVHGFQPHAEPAGATTALVNKIETWLEANPAVPPGDE